MSGEQLYILLRYQVRKGIKMHPLDFAIWKPLLILVRTFGGDGTVRSQREKLERKAIKWVAII